MLIPKQDIQMMMDLCKEEVQQILRDSGYSQTKLASSEFRGFNESSNAVYDIVAYDADGPSEARVYVQRVWKPEKNAFVLDADY